MMQFVILVFDMTSHEAHVIEARIGKFRAPGLV